MALDDALAVGEVVVGQFLARLDIAAGTNPDLFADDLAVAVRLARVVDEAADIAAHHRVPDPPAIDREAPDLTALQVLRLALEALFVINELALVRDDARVFVDGFEGEDSPTVELGPSPDDSR